MVLYNFTTTKICFDNKKQKCQTVFPIVLTT
jgi:hypothetical protein